MTAFDRSYRFRIYEQGSESVVEFTFVQEIAEAPTVPGQTARPEDGVVETVPWSVLLVDRNQVVSASLGDTAGRMSYHGRLADLSHRDAAGTWTVIATGRVSTVSEPERGSYQVQVDDERMIEREADVFQTTDTCCLAPCGLLYEYSDISPITPCYGRVTHCATVDGHTYIKLYLDVRIWNLAALAYMVDDVKAQPSPGIATGSNHDVGNFETLRIYVDGAEREIVSFGSYGSPSDRPPQTFVSYLEWALEDEAQAVRLSVWIPEGDADSGDNTWPTTPPSTGDEFTDCKIYAVGARPSSTLPLHLGVADASHVYGTADGGIHPFELLERLYTEAGVRFNATAMQALQDDPRYRLSTYRITEPPDNLADWVEANIYKPWQVLPFINGSGEVSPKSVALPSADTHDPSSLFEFTEHNMIGGAPTWQSPGRETINAVVGTFITYKKPASGFLGWVTGFVSIADPKGSIDRIRTTEISISVEHDNLANVQRREQKLLFSGLHKRFVANPMVNRYARDLFSLFGDGPQMGTIEGLRDTITVEPGDWVKVTTSDAPNLGASEGRGGTRLALVLSRAWLPAGPTFEILDAGPNVIALSTPTINSVVNNTDLPKHAQDVSYSGLPGTAATDWGYLEYAVSGTEPGATSSLWKLATIIQGSASGTETVYNLPAGETVWWRLRAATASNVRSEWSTAVSQTTTSLSAPTGLSFTDTSGNETKANWTNGEDAYPIEVLVDSTAIIVLVPGTIQSWVRNLEVATTYTIQVRHIDQYGGTSSLLGAANNLTTSGSANQWPAPHKVLVYSPDETRIRVPR